VKQARGLKDLFGNATIAPGRERSDTKTAAATSGLSGTMGAMSEAHERLLERGEKLNKLTDKSADVANAAEEFAKLAKQLNEQQKSRWF
jgi:Synaptobrevin